MTLLIALSRGWVIPRYPEATAGALVGDGHAGGRLRGPHTFFLFFSLIHRSSVLSCITELGGKILFKKICMRFVESRG